MAAYTTFTQIDKTFTLKCLKNLLQILILFRKWSKVETLIITEAVRDVAFAPNMGRTYHTLAVASKEVRIISLKPLR